MRQFHFNFYCFLFFGSDFFSNWFLNPFIVNSRPRFLFELDIYFSPLVLCSHMAFLHWFCFFCSFCLIFFRNCFASSIIVRSRFSVLLSQLYVRTCPAMFLLFRQDFCYDHMTSQPLFVHSFMQFRSCTFCSFVHAKRTQIWIACVTSFFSFIVASFFCSFAWLNFWSRVTYLTLKNDFLTLKMTFLKFDLKRYGQVSVCHSNWRLFKSS